MMLQPISASDLAIASVLVMINAVISIGLGLQLHKPVLWAAVRMVVQLLLVGLLLRYVLELRSPLATSLVILAMILAAAREVAVRPKWRLKGWKSYGISTAMVSATSIATVLLALLTAIRPSPWYDAHYAVPLMGIVLGSVLNSASLGLDIFFSGVTSSRNVVEGRLALGATRYEALAPHMRNAIRSGLIPVINQMSAAGIITLPGIMSGQILAGVDAVNAAKYQILLMFILAGASGLAATGSIYLAANAITDERHRLRCDRLENKKNGA
ncbi:iron export ABC transporter permease subunit FetB [Herbaspirillum lusitanum]|uniref:ABC transporter permease n=1 Tax=Herbaspirillum lusitanum TaxID=213312 RepID=UPI00223727AD|nr:iron export ABC transporter permease subunit FetB [Herbaspirillum lusitanum]MCW5299407.1 iron export ABC transporter permease subunit FetB [Herbaspirillum lusitanum]